MYLSMCLSTYLPIYLSVYLSIYLSIYLSAYVYLEYVYIYIYINICNWHVGFIFVTSQDHSPLLSWPGILQLQLPQAGGLAMQLIAELVGHVFETILGRVSRVMHHATGTGAPADIFVNISIYIYMYIYMYIYICIYIYVYMILKRWGRHTVEVTAWFLSG